MIHRFIDLISGVIGPAFTIEVIGSTTDRDNLHCVNAGAGAETTIITSADNEFRDAGVLSPDKTLVAYQYNDAVLNIRIYVSAIDGSGETEISQVDGNSTHPGIQWLDNTTVLWQDGGRLRRADSDGSNYAELINKSGLEKFSVAPDGSQVSYLWNNAGTLELWVCDPDGTNDTQVVSDCGTATSTGLPAWRTDSSAIVYPTNLGGTYRIRQIAPDGTGGADVMNPGPTGFFSKYAMHTDRLFYVDTSGGSDWKLANIVFGSGGSLVSPTLHLYAAEHVANPFVDQGRCFSTESGSFSDSGTNSLVSVLPDGSGKKVAYVADESSSPNFENIFMPI